MTELSNRLQQVLDDGGPSLGVLHACMESSNIEDRAAAYEAITDFKRISQFPDFEALPIYPRFCLRYLLDCICLELPATDDSNVHTRGEALFELTVPLAEVWVTRGVAIENQEFWDTVESFLQEMYPQFVSDFGTHFLEGVDRRLEFRKRVEKWRTDKALVLYLEDLDRVLGR